MGVVLSVLIVEDDPLVAAHQATLMHDSGYRVLASAQDAEAALLVAENSPPEIAIVDVGLIGNIDGTTVGRELHRRYGTAIVFVTGQLERAIRQMQDTDAVFIGKPFDDAEVLDAVEEALRRRN